MREKLFSLTIPGAENTQLEIDAPAGIPTGSQFTIGNIASAAISTMMIFGIILALLYLVWGGFFWIQSKGDKEQLDKARRIILYSIFGLIILSLSLVVVNVISAALNVQPGFLPNTN